MNNIKNTTLIFSLIVLIFGFFQINYENNIFADSRARCCNNSQCIGANCGTSSSINAGSTCTAYFLTCKDCIDFEVLGCMDNCSNSHNIYCLDDGVPYYGSEIFCPEW